MIYQGIIFLPSGKSCGAVRMSQNSLIEQGHNLMYCCPQLLEDGCDALDGVLRMHLSSAAGYYYHLLTHLQLCYHLGLQNLLSWGISPHQGEVFMFIDKYGVFFLYHILVCSYEQICKSVGLYRCEI